MLSLAILTLGIASFDAPLDRFVAGQDAFREGRLTEALAHMQAAAKGLPEPWNRSARVVGAKSAHRLGNHSDCLSLLEPVMADDFATKDRALLLRAQCAEALEHAETHEYWRAVWGQATSEDTRGYAAMGAARSAASDSDRQRWMSEAHELKLSRRLSHRLTLLSAREDTLSARHRRKLHELSLRNPESEEAHASRALLRKSGLNPSEELQWLDALLNARLLEDAEKQLAVMKATSPRRPYPSWLEEIRMREGILQYRKRQFNEALETFAGLKRNPKYEETARRWQARTYTGMNRAREGARLHLDAAPDLSNATQRANASYWGALLLDDAQAFEEASRAFGTYARRHRLSRGSKETMLWLELWNHLRATQLEPPKIPESLSYLAQRSWLHGSTAAYWGWILSRKTGDAVFEAKMKARIDAWPLYRDYYRNLIESESPAAPALSLRCPPERRVSQFPDLNMDGRNTQRAFELLWTQDYSALLPLLDKVVAENRDADPLELYRILGFDRPSGTLPFAFAQSICDTSREFDLDPLLLLALIKQESAFKISARSQVHAQGLMQLMPTTAQKVANALGIEGFEPELLANPATSIRMGGWYLASLMRDFDYHPVLALAAYNAGPHAVRDWYKKQEGVPASVWVEEIPYKETRDYVKKVWGGYVAYHQKYLGVRPTWRAALPAPSTLGTAVDF